MNRKLNLWYFIVSAVAFIILLILHTLFLVKVNPVIYYILAGPAIAALGNYLVIRKRERVREHK